MRSSRPKPLHIRSAVGRWCCTSSTPSSGCSPDRTALVVGHGAELVTKKVQELAPAWANVVFVEQAEQRGTGDAAAHGMSAFPGDDLDDDSTIVVLPGDAPLLQPETLDELVATHVANGSAATLLTSVLDDPTGYGRVIKARRRAGAADRRAARRQSRASSASTRSATSIYAFRRDLLGPALRHLSPDNAQGEFYLTDVVGVLGGMGHRVGRVAGPGRGDPGRQRPLAAGPRRARAALAHQPPLAAQRRHDARPPPDVHRRHGDARARRHAVPGHDPGGQHRRRRRQRDRPRHPARRLRGRARLPRPAHRRRRGRDQRPGLGRPVRLPACGFRTSAGAW